MARAGKIARRTFLVGTGIVAGGLAVGYFYARQPWDNPLEGAAGEGVFNPYVKIGTDEKITVIVPRAEMGQGVRTTLTALVAEELDVEIGDINVEHGPASGAYFNSAMMEETGPFAVYDDGLLAETVRTISAATGRVLGLQITGGSSSTRDAFDKMRRAGAAARHMLLEAGAKELGVPASELAVEKRRIVHAASSRSKSFGELALPASEIAVPGDVDIKSKDEWRLLGKSQARTDMLQKVTGAPIFGVDVDLPDMVYGTVKMSPRFWSRAVNADLSDAESIRGVMKIVALETQYGNGFGVLAENSWAAFQAADAIKADWSEAEYPGESAQIMKRLREAARGDTGSALRDDGDVDARFADAPGEEVLEADYEVPYLAHACMEPMNATAWLHDGKLEIWAPNQSPTLVQMICGDAAGIESENVIVHTTFLGGGFGRRGEVDYAIYAALMARESGGRPVKVTWTREEDITHDTYRPAAAGHFRALIGSDGYPTALDMNIATPSVMTSVMRRAFPSLSYVGPERLLSEGAFDQPYRIADYRVAARPVDITIPIGFWRSVGNSFNAYFHESFLDEIAAKGGVDPIAMRKHLMADFPPAIGVMEKLAEISNWEEALPEERAKGVAFTLSFGSWVGEVVQVAQTDRGLRIEKVWAVADVGEALDPAIIESQITSGIIFGLSSAIGQEITFSDGTVQQSNFHDFDAMRMYQCPEFEVAILENSGHMGGVGEIGTPPSIPALANAVFALTGKRIRQMPLSKEIDFA